MVKCPAKRPETFLCKTLSGINGGNAHIIKVYRLFMANTYLPVLNVRYCN